MRIRLRGPLGASTVVLQGDATVGILRSEIAEKTALNKFDIKYGYPPKPLHLDKDSTLLSDLQIKLDGEQLTITAQDGPIRSQTLEVGGSRKESNASFESPTEKDIKPAAAVLFAGVPNPPKPTDLEVQDQHAKSELVSLKRKNKKEMEVPELALPDRGATLRETTNSASISGAMLTVLVLRVMPDDNSCLFRAFGTAVLPGDDLSMTELRALVASRIQAEPDVFTQVVLEQKPDDYCRWIQTEDAWGGAIEMGILAQHFEIEICSIDVQVFVH